MTKYILVSKDNLNNTYTLYESDDYKFIYKKYKLWCNILSKNNFSIYAKIEGVD